MNGTPGCTVESCTNKAAYKIVHDDRLTDCWRCFEHVAEDILRETSHDTPNVTDSP